MSITAWHGFWFHGFSLAHVIHLKYISYIILTKSCLHMLPTCLLCKIEWRGLGPGEDGLHCLKIIQCDKIQTWLRTGNSALVPGKIEAEVHSCRVTSKYPEMNVSTGDKFTYMWRFCGFWREGSQGWLGPHEHLGWADEKKLMKMPEEGSQRTERKNKDGIGFERGNLSPQCQMFRKSIFFS